MNNIKRLLAFTIFVILGVLLNYFIPSTPIMDYPSNLILAFFIVWNLNEHSKENQ